MDELNSFKNRAAEFLSYVQIEKNYSPNTIQAYRKDLFSSTLRKTTKQRCWMILKP